MTPWLRRASAIACEVSARACVDDLTSWSNDPENCADHVAELVELTQSFARDTGLKDNVVKSRRFTTTPALRNYLKGLPGPMVEDWFKDLGVIQ
eukprot:9309063-Heterocapsa_arctica.AAC.1